MVIHRFNYVCDDCGDKVIGVTFEEFQWYRRGMFLKCLCKTNKKEIHTETSQDARTFVLIPHGKES
jgi:hypothetical protein